MSDTATTQPLPRSPGRDRTADEAQPAASPAGMPQRVSSAPAPERRVPDDMHNHLRTGFAVTFLLAMSIGGWAATTRLAGAVVGAGTVVVESNVKKVQHPTGGIVGEIKVRDGLRVKEGDLLLRLDDTITRANLGIIVAQLDELNVRQARLIAERDGADTIEMPDNMAERLKLPEVARIVTGETSLFMSRRQSREGQKSQLRERLNQLGEEIGGLVAQHTAKTKEVQFVQIELTEIEKLFAKNLAPLSKRIALNREATRIDGERAQLTAAMAQARAKIAETQLQIIQLESDLRTEVTRDLREIQGKQSELGERRIAADDQLRRVEIRAPQTGTIHQLAVHTVGGVINAGEPVMLIVPDDEKLVLEVKVGPQDISQVHMGQEAYVRLTSFNQRTTPEIKGRVSRISADLTRDQQANLAYYVVRLALADDEIKKLGSEKLVPGMPAEVYIETEERTALSYVLKPLFDQIARAFKER